MVDESVIYDSIEYRDGTSEKVFLKQIDTVNGVTVILRYDKFGRLIESKTKDDFIRIKWLDDTNMLYKMLEYGNGFWIRYHYTKTNKLISSVDSNSKVTGLVLVK